MSERFQRLRAIVEAALDVDPDEREAHVAEACAGDEALRAEALELLETSVDDEFLQPAPSLSGLSEELDAIGGFKILRQLGRGGMGLVYEAEQQTPRRRVALKVLARGLHSPQSLERFRYEVEILGTLDHPHIAKVHDAGTSSSSGAATPWFAMELVEGARPITQFADAEQLGTQARLAQFLDVLDAVQHGHQKGVTHRDLKPDNVLVDAGGRVKVIDFGVARVADPELLRATMQTQLHEMVGTLAYMSPEQAAGRDVDARADVYALGVMLFRLLSGELPIPVERTDLPTSIRRIAEDPPKRLRSAAPGLHADLDAILARALAKEPERRYRSAGAMADDLRRHMRGEAVEARAPSLAYQLALFARRNKVLVGAAAVLVLGLGVATIVSMDFAFESKAAEEQSAKERARFETLYRTQFLQNVDLIAKDAARVAHLHGGGPLAQRMIEDAVARLEVLAEDEDAPPAFRLKLADAYVRLAAGLGDLGRSHETTEHARSAALDRASALVEQVRAAAPADRAALRLRVAVIGARAGVALSAGRLDDAHRVLGEALEAAAEAALDAKEATLLSLQHLAARIGYRRGDADEAFANVSQSLATREALGGDDEVSRRRLADEYRLRAEIERTRRHFAESKQDLLRCMTLREQLTAAHPENLVYQLEEGQTALALGLIHLALRQPDRVAHWYSRAHALLASLHERSPHHLGVTIEYARSLQGLGQMQMSDAIGTHAKGSPGRLAGLEAALENLEAAQALAKEAAAARPDSANAIGLVDQLGRQVAVVRRVLGR